MVSRGATVFFHSFGFTSPLGFLYGGTGVYQANLSRWTWDISGFTPEDHEHSVHVIQALDGRTSCTAGRQVTREDAGAGPCRLGPTCTTQNMGQVTQGTAEAPLQCLLQGQCHSSGLCAPAKKAFSIALCPPTQTFPTRARFPLNHGLQLLPGNPYILCPGATTLAGAQEEAGWQTCWDRKQHTWDPDNPSWCLLELPCLIFVQQAWPERGELPKIQTLVP